MRNEDIDASDSEISVSKFSQLIRYVSSINIDADGLMRSKGLDPNILDKPDARIPVVTFLAILEEAIRLSEDEYFGLHAGQFAEVGNFSIVGYLMMNCRDLREVSYKSQRYERIVSTSIQNRTRFGLRKVRSIYSTPAFAPPLPGQSYDCALSGLIRLLRNLTGVSIDPLEVTFTHPRPASVDEYDRIFHCPVLFGHRYNSIVFDARVASIPVLNANPGLLEHFESYARDFLASIECGGENTRRVTELILSHLDSESLSIRNIAKDMGLSARTLQARLKAEGMFFGQVLHDTRERLAKKYLKENYSVDDITYLLGFSEPSVFRRSFKRWVGVTPKEYRESLHGKTAERSMLPSFLD